MKDEMQHTLKKYVFSHDLHAQEQEDNFSVSVKKQLQKLHIIYTLLPV